MVYFPRCNWAMYNLDLLPSDFFTQISPVFIAVIVALQIYNIYVYT